MRLHKYGKESVRDAHKKVLSRYGSSTISCQAPTSTLGFRGWATLEHPDTMIAGTRFSPEGALRMAVQSIKRLSARVCVILLARD